MSLLKAFNPHELTPRVVLSVATGREKPLEQILSVIRNNLDAPVKQHIIVSAPRGYGKSFFLRYVEVKVGEIAKAEGLPIAMALLPEELPHVKEPDTLVAEIKRTFLSEPADTVSVRWLEDDGTAWEDAIFQLDFAIKERFGAGRGLLVAGVENFDLLVKKAFAKPVQSGRLREFLVRPGNRIMLLAASARGAFDRSYDLPLFKAFDEVVLEPWTIDQTVEFLIAQRKAANKPALTQRQLAKASAVAAFISGTPRLAALIGEALLEGDPLGAADLLEKIVDELTPYYKERIEVLPTRSQALLDALLRGGEKCSATELARRVGAPSQSAIAAPLDDLKKDLVVVGEKSPSTAEVLHRVADRVFAHYYRKRILSHGENFCPLEALVDILALIYSPEEKQREAEKFAARGLAREAAIMFRLWEAEREVGPPKIAETAHTSSPEFSNMLTKSDRAIADNQYTEAVLYSERALIAAQSLGNKPAQISALLKLAWLHGQLYDYQKALEAAREAADLAADIEDVDYLAAAQRLSSWALGGLRRYEEALVTAQDAAETALRAGSIEERRMARLNAVWALTRLGRPNEAIVIARDVASEAEEAADKIGAAIAISSLASALREAEQLEEALGAARDAAARAESAGDLNEQIMSLLQVSRILDELDRAAEALEMMYAVASMADRVNDLRIHVMLACELLRLRPSNIGIAMKHYRTILQGAVALNDNAASIYFDDIAGVASRERGWPELIALMEEFPAVADQILDKPYVLGEPGKVFCEVFRSDGDEGALAIARHFVSALAAAVPTGTDAGLTRLWTSVLNASAEAIVSALDNTEALRELAEICAAYESVPNRCLNLLGAAAAYHQSGRDQRELARLDPDLTTMLTVVFPPKNSGSRPKRHRRKKRH